MDNEIAIREAKPGEPSLVVYFYYKLFEEQYQFRGSTEEYFMSSMVDYFHDPENNRLWVAVQNEEIVGSVLLIKRGEHEAQLRTFGTSMSVQGKGVGTKLMQVFMDYCKEKGFDHIYLWTIEMLKPARHLYSKFGFKHTEDKPNDEWADYHMVEERWDYQV